MLKKLFSFIGVVVILAALGVGGYHVYKFVYLKNTGEFKITYAYESWTGLEYDTKKVGCVKGYTGKSIENVVISSFFDDNGTSRTVVGIKANSFKDNKEMKTVDVPNTVYTFGANIFSGCANLNSITLRYSQGEMIPNFSLVFDGIDLTKVTFNVPSQSMKDKIVASYSTANVIINPSL